MLMCNYWVTHEDRKQHLLSVTYRDHNSTKILVFWFRQTQLFYELWNKTVLLHWTHWFQLQQVEGWAQVRWSGKTSSRKKRGESSSNLRRKKRGLNQTLTKEQSEVRIVILDFHPHKEDEKQMEPAVWKYFPVFPKKETSDHPNKASGVKKSPEEREWKVTAPSEGA